MRTIHKGHNGFPGGELEYGSHEEHPARVSREQWLDEALEREAQSARDEGDIAFAEYLEGLRQRIGPKPSDEASQ